MANLSDLFGFLGQAFATSSARLAPTTLFTNFAPRPGPSPIDIQTVAPLNSLRLGFAPLACSSPEGLTPQTRAAAEMARRLVASGVSASAVVGHSQHAEFDVEAGPWGCRVRATYDERVVRAEEVTTILCINGGYLLRP